MNIFYLDEDVTKAAQYHNDKHCVKMILEYAQLLCTAHRVLDGQRMVITTDKGRKKTIHKHPNPNLDNILYGAGWLQHPSAIWARASKANYEYLYALFNALCTEYTHRYGKIHLTYQKLNDILKHPPQNIDFVKQFTQPTPAMPDDVKNADSKTAYRDYYNKYKQHLDLWTKRERPEWIKLNEIS